MYLVSQLVRLRDCGLSRAHRGRQSVEKLDPSNFMPRSDRPDLWLFNLKFDHGELYEVNSSRDAQVVNNLPHGTLS